MKNCPVFICYRQTDGTEIAQWLFKILNGQRLPDSGHAATEEHGSSLDVYFDQTAPAVGDWKAIHQPRLHTSQAMIVVCSPGAVHRLENDDWVHREIEWWLKNRRVAPILIDATGEGERTSSDERDFQLCNSYKKFPYRYYMPSAFILQSKFPPVRY